MTFTNLKINLSSKTLVRLMRAGMVLATLTAGLPAAAERMDKDTHTIIISKLESALSSMKQPSTEKSSITLRLADLYADRARLQLLAKNDQNCAECSDGKQDRERAITLYKSVINTLKTETQGTALLQLAHLQNANGQSKDATATFTRASDERRYGRDTNARARAGLGEIKFRKGDFKAAEKDFIYALNHKEIPNAGFLNYRLAWSQLNQGKAAAGTATLVALLQNPELLTNEANGKTVFDQSFHDDITKDLVVFLARGDVGQKEIDLLLNLSPEKLRRENLYALANELERLGKKYSATLAWAAYDQEGDSSPLDSVERQIRVAQLQWDMGRKAEALEEYTKATEIWRKKGCKGDKCEDVAKRFKNFVINWNKTEKDQPSRLCLDSYKAYLTAFSSEAEMFYKAGTVADQQKAHIEAFNFYTQAAVITSQRKEKSKANVDLLENSLLKQIEAAELTKDKGMRLKAYNTYLELNASGSKALEVRYQKAQVTYDMGQVQSAYEQFTAIATEKATDQRALRVKAADLSLDALATLKNDSNLFEQAGRLIPLYSERANEYRKIQRQAAIHLAAAALNSKSSSDGQLQNESNRLAKLDLKNATKDELILIYKNRISLGERLRDLNQVTISSNGLLAIKGLKEKDQEFAMGRLAWVAELKLDFKTALKIARKMSLSNMAPEDRHLRLAMLSELAGQNPTKDYQAALKATRNNEKALGIRATLVRLASNPWSALKQHQGQLRQKPELFSSLVIEAYAKTGDERSAHSMLKNPALRNSSLAQLFRTRELLTDWRQIDRDLARHVMYSGSEAVLGRSLTKRIDLLNKIDRIATDSVKQGDWLGQLASLMTIERENRRIHSELLRLPVPRKLKEKEKEQYLALLKSKAEPFKTKSEQASVRVEQFWGNSAALQKFDGAFEASQGYTRNLIKQNLSLVAKVADDGQKRKIETILASRESRPSMQDIANAQSRLKNDPFDTGHVNDLKRLAEKRGETTMVAYLDARLSQMKKGVQ